MAIYEISMLGNSPVQISGDVQLGDYTFTALDDRNNVFSVRSKIEATSWRDALGKFNKGVWPIMDAIAFHRMSAISSYGVSTVIQKERTNIALAMLMQRIPGVGLRLAGHESWQSQRDEIMTLARSDDEALSHFRSAMLGTGANAISFHLLQCAEALAGSVAQSTKCLNCGKTLKCAACGEKHRPVMTDRSELKIVLGDNLFDFFYTKQPGESNNYRNLLAHGYDVDEAKIAEKVDLLFDAMKTTLKNKYNIHNMPSVSGVKFLESYGRTNLFIEYDQPLPSPAKLAEMIKANEIGHDTTPYRIDFEADQSTLDAY